MKIIIFFTIIYAIACTTVQSESFETKIKAKCESNPKLSYDKGKKFLNKWFIPEIMAWVIVIIALLVHMR